MSTIFAVSSGLPPAAIAVVRISGPDAIAAATALAGDLPAPRHATVRALRHPFDGALPDRALVLTFPGPASATGEDVVELHVHGGRAVIAAVGAALASRPGLRLAEPGEFTRRALLNGRIDLAQAEGLGDLLTAETEAQRRAAVLASEGGISRTVAGWTHRLLAISAQVEALLDFADEEDVIDAPAAWHVPLSELAADMEQALGGPTVEELRDGVRVVLAGPPNSGKSSLFNVLLQRDAAIVSPIAGTTRDVIEAEAVVEGIVFRLVDTAGLVGDTADPIEAIGVRRAQASMTDADVVLWCGDAPGPGKSIPLHMRADLPERTAVPGGRLAVSAATELGVAALWRVLLAHGRSHVPRSDQLTWNQRQRSCCLAALQQLDDATKEADPLLVAERLRSARVALDEVRGVLGTEEMLDALFSRFCIGK